MSRNGVRIPSGSVDRRLPELVDEARRAGSPRRACRSVSRSTSVMIGSTSSRNWRYLSGQLRREPACAPCVVSGLFETSSGAGASDFRAGGRDEVRHGERAALGETAVVVALAARDVLHGRNEQRDVRAGAGFFFDVRERRPLVGRRNSDRLALEDRPVPIRAGRRLGIEEDARVLAERRVLEVRPDLDGPEQTGAARP